MGHHQAVTFQHLESSGGEGELFRPWTSYWPPLPGSRLYKWLEAEIPDALSWRFRPESPFDQPWKIWIRQLREAGKSYALDPPHRPDPVASSYGKVADEGAKQKELSRQENTRQIDEEIKSLELPAQQINNFEYLAWDPRFLVEKPFRSRLPFLDGLGQDYVLSQPYSVPIHDISGAENHFTLDTSGFSFLRVPAKMEEWSDDSIRNQYLPQMQKWLKEYFGSESVYIFTYSLRCKDKHRNPAQPWLDPVMRVHCDITPKSSVTNLKVLMPDKATDVRRRRHRFVNLWRPLTAPFQDYPLAVCDFRSISATDLIATDVIFPHYCNEGFEVRHSPHHRWFYKPGMSVDDVILFTMFDNDPTKATLCPHAAFLDPSAPLDTLPRASIEIRAIVLG